MLDQKPAGRNTERFIVAVIFLAVAAVAFAIFKDAIRNDFIWDDPILLNMQLPAFHSVKDVFFPPPKIPQFGIFYYRPLLTLSYLVDKHMWGDGPMGFHLSVVLFHALNSALVFLLGWRVFGPAKAGLLAAVAGAVLFATHPIHTESVCWMAGRSDTITTFFILASFLAYLAWRPRMARRWILAVSLLLFLAACLAKETAVCSIGIVIIADWLGIGARKWEDARPAASGPSGRMIPGSRRVEDAAAEAEADVAKLGIVDARGGTSTSHPGAGRAAEVGAPGRRGIKADDRHRKERESRRAQKSKVRRSIPWRARIPLGAWIAFISVALFYIVLRTIALGRGRGSFRVQHADLGTSLMNVVASVGFYLSKLSVPTGLDAFIPEVPDFALSFTIGLVGAAVAGRICYILWKRGNILIPFLSAWIFVSLAPSLAIAFFDISETPVAERYLYLPSAGFCLLLGYLAFVEIPSLFGPRARAKVMVGVGAATLALASAYALGTVHRGRIWRSDLEFWKTTSANSPDEGLPHLQLGLAYQNAKQSDLAEQEYRTALAVKYDNEGRAIASTNLGMLFYARMDEAQAEQLFRDAIRYQKNYAYAHYGLAIVFKSRADRARSKGQSDEAAENYRQTGESLKRAIQANPQFTQAKSLLSAVEAQLGRPAPPNK